GGGVGPPSKGPLRIVGQWIARQNGRDLRIYRYEERVTGERRRVLSLPLSLGRHREHLRGPQHLAETLILPEEKGAIPALVNSRQRDRPTQREAEFIAPEGGDAAGVGQGALIEEIARIEGRVAHEFKNRAVKQIRPCLGYDVGEAGSTVANFRRHHPRKRLDFLHRVHVEVGKGGATQFRV